MEKCFKGFDLCSFKINWIKTKIYEAVISSFILALLIELIFYRLISAVNLFHLILFYIIAYSYSHGITFEDHGHYNFLGSILLIIIFLLVISPINILLYLIQLRNKAYIFLFVIGLLLIWSTYLMFSQYYINCNDWKYGLNHSFIDNDVKHGCKIIFPKNCPYKIGKYFLDKSKIFKIDCNEKMDTKQKLIKFSKYNNININTTRVGFPLPNKNKEIHMGSFKHTSVVKNFYKSNLVDMDNKTLVENIFKNEKPEIIVDYNKNKFGELIINVDFNKTLSEERKISEKNSSPYSENIIILFIDSVSRAYSIRSLKKTLKFFEKFMSYKGGHNSDFLSDNFHSFQFFKYHSFNRYTRFNYPQIFYGRVWGKLVRNIKFLKENGYVTCFVNDMCYNEPTHTLYNMTDEEISDHEMLICDPNMKDSFSTTKRCLYNKISASYAYEYGDQFWRKYGKNRKYLNINLEDGHEGTLEVLKYTDDIIYNFLNNLFKENLLKSTSIFLFSDHGTQAPSPYHITSFYFIEKFLPMLYIICNDRKNISYNEQYLNMKNNQQILITGYDIYNTISNLVFGEKYNSIKFKTENKETPKSKLGISLFNKINSKMRAPKYYENMTKKICI